MALNSPSQFGLQSTSPSLFPLHTILTTLSFSVFPYGDNEIFSNLLPLYSVNSTYKAFHLFKPGQHLKFPVQRQQFGEAFQNPPVTEMVTTYFEPSQHYVSISNKVLIECKMFSPLLDYDCFQDSNQISFSSVTIICNERQGSQKLESDFKGSEDDVSFEQFIDILMHNLIKQEILYYKPSVFKLTG